MLDVSTTICVTREGEIAAGEPVIVNSGIVALESSTRIRKLDWIERNRALVDRLGGGRVGYLYLSDFNALGSEDFLRQFYGQADKGALIVDFRDNRGRSGAALALDLYKAFLN